MTTVARDVSGTDSSSWAPIRLDGAELTGQRHVCAMFRDEAEQYRLAARTRSSAALVIGSVAPP